MVANLIPYVLNPNVLHLTDCFYIEPFKNPYCQSIEIPWNYN